MKRISAVCILAVLLAALLAAPALAQGPTCNEQRAAGIARSELAQCIAAPTGPDLFVEVDALCECPEFGISVNAIARVRCNPNEECPPFGILIGSVTLDCNYNVIDSVCF
ncbi:MAG TPA: hypothetical protein VF179_02050 [Thermoanaerobaculia bacterium]|nr:hypothetical protein [Thermoanaerobaculia bacterium]